MTLEIQSIRIAKRALEQGLNISETLRNLNGLRENTEQIIEISYELQSGQYVEHFESNKQPLEERALEYAGILDDFVDSQTVLLDVGSGELTTLSLVLNRLSQAPKNVVATDISWSRLAIGRRFANHHLEKNQTQLDILSCQIPALPFSSKSIDVTTSNHALEPNGDRLKEILSELFRVTVHYLVLFEPYFEGSTDKGKERMQKHGYFKGLESAVAELGGVVKSVFPVKNSLNGLNKTYCFVISPPEQNLKEQTTRTLSQKMIYTIPGTDYPLAIVDGFHHSTIMGLSFPTLDGIPILRMDKAILSSFLTR